MMRKTPSTALPAARLRLFFADPPLRSARLAIHGLGIGEWMRPSIVDRPRGTPCWQVMAFHDAVDLEVDGHRERHPGGCLLIWNPRGRQWYGRSDRRWNHSWLLADGSFLQKTVQAAAIPVGRPIVGFAPAILEESVAAMHREFRDHADPDPVIIENLMHNLLREAARIAAPQADRIPPHLVELQRWIEEHSTDRITLTGLAFRCGMSVPHLCACFRRSFQTSPIAYVIRVRMRRAQMLLRDRNLRIAQVAAAVGYDDVHHFSKLFRQHYGVPPRTLSQRAQRDELFSAPTRPNHGITS